MNPDRSASLNLPDCYQRPFKGCLLLLSLLISHQNLAQQPGPTAPPTVASTSPAKAVSDKSTSSRTIKGRIVVAGGRVPKNALVSIRALNGTSGQSRMTRVDPDGRFVFDDLGAGIYTILATAPGFVDETLAVGDVSGLPRHLPGAQVTVRMMKGGVITGTITNQKGDPVVGVNVRALMIGDRRNLRARFSGETHHVETDDRGIYRIYGLLPGEYLVAAGGRGPLGPFISTGFDLDAPTYYPSTNRDTAVPVGVRSGEEATNIDIRYRNVPGYSISGVVRQAVDKSTHVNISSVSLYDVKANNMLSVASSNLDSAERSFKFDGIADGEYELLATFFSRGEANWSSATKRLTVSGADITGVDITLKTLASVQGSIKLEPVEDKCDKRGSQRIEMVLSAISESKGRDSRLRSMYSLEGTITANNTFKIRNLEPGRFRFVTQLPTEAWYLRDIHLPAPQISKTPAQPSGLLKTAAWQGTGTIKSGEDIRDVVITIGQDAASVSGSVMLAKGLSIALEELHVYLVPADREQADNALRYYETRVEADGRFHLSHVAPGRYFSVARLRPADQTTEWQRSEVWDPLKRVELRRVAETARNEIELKSCQKLNDYVLNVEVPRSTK